MRRLFLATLVAAMLGGCATLDYARLAPGSFKGSLFVMWIDEGGSSGDGTFLFVPDPRAPLEFRRADARRPGAVIRPGMMYTDGGSIPKIAQAFNGLSPWGYAPAYMIHDWMFVARHCLIDGVNEPRFDQVRDVTFEDSAEILGEAIRGLVAERQVLPNDVAGSTITAAVNSSIARNLWNARGACAGSRVKPDDVAAAERAIPGSSQMALRSFSKPEGARTATARRPAKVVARVTF